MRALGARGREFESRYPDKTGCSTVGYMGVPWKHVFAGSNPAIQTSSFNMVEVAQLAEHQIVVLVVAGSSPVLHPKYRL